MYARGEDIPVLKNIEEGISSLLEKEGFNITSYEEAEVKLYVNPDHQHAMYGLEKESGVIVGVSCNSRRSDSGRTIYIANNGKGRLYSSGGGGYTRRGRWFEPYILESLKEGLGALSEWKQSTK